MKKDRIKNINKMNEFIDYSILKPTATVEDIIDGCIHATKHKLKAVCVSSGNVKIASQWHKNVCSVISFPHGNTGPRSKYSESFEAIIDGAKELDVVINYGRYLGGDVGIIERDLRPICSFAKELNVTVKAILETCYYSSKQLTDACKKCVDSGVDFVKTSTGSVQGATIMDVFLMLAIVKGSNVQVKASGGIKTKKRAQEFIDLGCTRIGMSHYE